MLGGMKTAALLGLVILSSCATVARGARQKVTFTSEPPGAAVSIGKASGVTPCELYVARLGRPQSFTVELEGHEPLEADLPAWTDSGMQTLAVLETVFLLLPGIVDFATGATRSVPHAAHATLPELGAGEAKVKYTLERPGARTARASSRPVYGPGD